MRIAYSFVWTWLLLLFLLKSFEGIVVASAIDTPSINPFQGTLARGSWEILFHFIELSLWFGDLGLCWERERERLSEFVFERILIFAGAWIWWEGFYGFERTDQSIVLCSRSWILPGFFEFCSGEKGLGAMVGLTGSLIWNVVWDFRLWMDRLIGLHGRTHMVFRRTKIGC